MGVNMNKVHVEGERGMNNTATSRAELLEICAQLASEKGFQALGIRDLAEAAGVSVGCIYNYFPSKASLLAAVVAARITCEILTHNACKINNA